MTVYIHIHKHVCILMTRHFKQAHICSTFIVVCCEKWKILCFILLIFGCKRLREIKTHHFHFTRISLKAERKSVMYECVCMLSNEHLLITCFLVVILCHPWEVTILFDLMILLKLCKWKCLWFCFYYVFDRLDVCLIKLLALFGFFSFFLHWCH